MEERRTDTRFMNKKFSVATLIEQYKTQVRALRSLVKTPAEESKLQYYYQAVDTIGRSSLKDKVQFALSFGRSQSGMVPQMRQAFPMLLGNRVTQPSAIDLAYARLLLAYAVAFDQHKGNLKDWMLRFVINSPFSPARSFVQQQIDHAIEQTREKINYYQTKF